MLIVIASLNLFSQMMQYLHCTDQSHKTNIISYQVSLFYSCLLAISDMILEQNLSCPFLGSRSHQFGHNTLRPIVRLLGVKGTTLIVRGTLSLDELDKLTCPNPAK